MSEAPADGRLYRQLPAFWRVRDAEAGSPLRALLGVIEAQAAILEDDVHRLYDGLFVETCDAWAVPYIGDLVGTTPLFDPSAQAEPPLWHTLFPDLAGAAAAGLARLMPVIAARARPDVAKTIHYRRRKGTAPMLEELARDVTGWPARLVEFFALLGWTQAIRNHVRHGAGGWVDLRSPQLAERVGTAFDATTRSVDVRPFAGGTGRHGVPKIGFFLWRLRPLPLDGIDARAEASPADWRFRASPLGQDAPLFIRPQLEDDETGQATELHVPGPIRPGLLLDDLAAARAEGRSESALVGPFGGGASLSVTLIGADGTEEVVSAHRLRCMTLEPWVRPGGDRVGIDVRSGRIALGAAIEAAAVRLGVVSASVADLGGGSYARAAWLVRNDLGLRRYGVGEGGYATLRAALAAWEADGKPDALIRIADSRSYHETAGGPLAIEPSDPDPVTGCRGLLVIEAADRARPHLRLDTPLSIIGDHPESMVTLSGLLIEGAVSVSGTLRRLRLLHCTLVPGRRIAGSGPASPPPASPVEPSLTIAGGTAAVPRNTGLSVECAFSILGPVRMPGHARQLVVLDSIVDGVNTAAIAGPGAPGEAPPLVIERSTVFGDVRAVLLPMLDTTIVRGAVRVSRRGEGCVRFSYTGEGSATPRRVRCQPDLAEAMEIAEAEAAKGAPLTQAQRAAAAARARRRLQPVFAALRYGQPAYGQLGRACPDGIAEGAEDGSAMGVTCHLKEPQRLSNLRRRLEEYLPLGLEPGIVFVT